MGTPENKQGDQEPSELDNLDDDFQPQSEDEIRQELISKHSLDEESDKDLLESMVADKVDDQKKLSKAIGQKIKTREELEKIQADKDKNKAGKDKDKDGGRPAPLTKEEAEQLWAEKDAEKELRKLQVSDDLKDQIKTVAKIKGVSIDEAMQDEFIQHKIELEETDKKNENASIKSGGGSKRVKQDFTEKPMSGYDMTKEEDRKAWEEHKKQLKSQQKQ